MKTYTQGAVDRFIDKYISRGGEVTVLDEGSLLTGLMVCQAEGMRSSVISEVYLGPWSSAYKVRQYRKLPKKYQTQLEALA